MSDRNLMYGVDKMTAGGEKANLNLLGSKAFLPGKNEAIDILMKEGGESFYNYLEWIGLLKDPDLIILSSVHHYYFDTAELKNTKTIINLKQLNLIKDIDVFLHSINRIMSPKSNLVGCFLDNKSQHENSEDNILSQYQVKNNVDPFENGITSRVRFINTIYNYFDSKTDRFLSRDNVGALLRKHGFEVLDMTELNGLTYFQSQKPWDLKN